MTIMPNKMHLTVSLSLVCFTSPFKTVILNEKSKKESTEVRGNVFDIRNQH